MSTYATAVCHALRERIDHGRIGVSARPGALVTSPASGLVVALLVSGRWPSAEVVQDTGEAAHLWDEAEDYRDVTEEAVALYNEHARVYRRPELALVSPDES